MAVPEIIPVVLPLERPDLVAVKDHRVTPTSVTLPTNHLFIKGRTQLGKSHNLEHGTKHRYLYTFSDGISKSEPVHEVRLYEPSASTKRERGFMSTVPWLTGLDGHHESLNEEAIASDIISVAVGREVSNVVMASRKIGHITLAREANVQLLVHQDLAQRGHFMREELTGTGY
jgi:hypothetical protein